MEARTMNEKLNLHDAGNDATPKALWLTAIVVFSLYVGVATHVLTEGHLNEDAYILFQYVQNVAAGNGIVFDSLSGPAEGATDFLWMIMLACLAWIQVPPGVGAAIINGLGLALIAVTLINIRGRLDTIAIAAISLVAMSQTALASISGFSAFAYGGVFSLLLYAALTQKPIAAVALGLLLALIRPDGTLLAGGTILAMLLFSDSRTRRHILIACIPATLVGLGYFAWRATYFGFWLPLPLIVKSNGVDAIQSITTNWRAIDSYVYLLLVTLLVSIHKKVQMPTSSRFVITLAGASLLLLALSSAHQSQNIGYRFQFPAVIALVFLLVIIMNQFGRNYRKFQIAMTIFCAGVALSSARSAVIKGDELVSQNYMNSFPLILRERGFELQTIAITEAGRFPYWYNAPRMIDIVGLNSPSVVIAGPKTELEKYSPSFVFAYHGRVYRTDELPREDKYVVLEAKDIRVNPYGGDNPVILAALAALEYAQKNNFRAVLVKSEHSDKDFRHAFFLSQKIDLERFLTILDESFTSTLGYLASEKIRASLQKRQ